MNIRHIDLEGIRCPLQVNSSGMYRLLPTGVKEAPCGVDPTNEHFRVNTIFLESNNRASEVKICRLIELPGILAGRAFHGRLRPFVYIAADPAFPFDRGRPF